MNEKGKRNLKKRRKAHVKRHDIIRDKLEHKRIKKEPAGSEQAYRDLADHAATGMATVDLKGRFTYVNRVMADFIGHPAQDLMGRPFKDCIHPEDRSRMARLFLKAVLLRRPPSEVELRAMRPDGSVRHLLMRPWPMRAGGKTIGFSAVTVDITERKQMEDALTASEERYRNLVERMHDALLVFGEDRRIEFANRQVEAFVGYKPEEIIGERFDKFLTPEGMKSIAERYEKRRRGEPVPSSYELQAVAKDGTVKDFEISAALYTIDGKPKTIAAFKDITERKRMEETLRKSEEKLRSLLESSMDSVSVSVGTKLVYANKRCAEQLGFSDPGDLTGRDLAEFIAPEDREMVVARTLARERGEHVPQMYEFKIQRRDGTKIPVETNATPIEYEGKKATLFFRRDMTERKLMEQELRESEARYRGLFENSQDAITINTPDGKYLGFNQAYLNLLGYSRDEMLELNASNSYANRADRDRFRQEVERNGFVKDFEVKLRRKDGAVRDCLLTSTAWRNEQGQTIGYQGIVRDITDRKRMEEQYKTILETALDGFWRVDASGRFLDVNDAYARMIGYSRSELLTMRIQDVEAKEAPAETAERIRRIMATGSDRFETRHRRKDGQIIDIEVSVNYLPGDGGQLFVFLREITERRRAEEMLRISEAKLRALHRHTKELAVAKTIEEVAKQTLDAMEFTLGFDVADFCTVEKDRIRVRGSRGIQAAPKLWEWPLEEPGVVVKSVETKKTLRVPDTRKEPSFVDRRTLSETEKPQLSELTVPVLTDNTVVGVLNVESSELNAFTEGDQELLETLATHVASALGRLRQVDTLEKLVEERTSDLKESEEKFRRIYNTSLSAIYTTTLAGDILDMNPTGVSMLGYDSSDELRKVNIVSLYVTPKERARFIELANQGHVRGFETQFRRKDGKILDVLANAHVLRDDRDQIAGFQLSLTDITEHKRMERMRDEFVADVTDELLTPLVSIKGYIDYVLKEKQTSLPEDTASNLQAVKRNTDRLLDITNALVDVRRMESGRLELNLHPLDLREIVEQCARETQFLTTETQSLRVQLPEGPLPIQGDRARLNQILMNLLSNAMKYAPEGETTLRVKTMEDSIEVQVSDTGMGIRKEDLARIFEPFAAIQKTTYVKGAGLGLSVTKGLVEAHGGKIWAESKGEGKGATFAFTLPRRRGGN